MHAMPDLKDADARRLFELYMNVVGVPQLEPKRPGDPRLQGKKLGVVNGSSWVSLWSNFFARRILPEVQLVNVGNEGVQLNFMKAHREGLPTPPQINIDLFVRYARDLVDLVGVDAILISCSTMNRAYVGVAQVLHPVPVVSIDMPMMERAVERGGRVLLVATHGPTVENTRRLLEETAAQMGRSITHAGATVEDAFHLLGEGKVEEHNEVIARAIREAMAKQEITTVVLAQLSMTIFKLTYPDAEATFGVPVLTSGEEGFRRIREILLGQE